MSIARTAMSDELRHSAGSIGVVSNITQYGDQIERLISGGKPPVIISTDETVEDPSAFAMEAHLEDFLVANWSHTELAKDYDIYEDNVQKAQQYPTDTGRIDILAVSRDKKTLLVVELKKGKAADVAVGQTLRYMGFVKEELAEGMDCQALPGELIDQVQHPYRPSIVRIGADEIVRPDVVGPLRP